VSLEHYPPSHPPKRVQYDPSTITPSLLSNAVAVGKCNSPPLDLTLSDSPDRARPKQHDSSAISLRSPFNKAGSKRKFDSDHAQLSWMLPGDISSAHPAKRRRSSSTIPPSQVSYPDGLITPFSLHHDVALPSPATVTESVLAWDGEVNHGIDSISTARLPQKYRRSPAPTARSLTHLDGTTAYFCSFCALLHQRVDGYHEMRRRRKERRETERLTRITFEVGSTRMRVCTTNREPMHLQMD
jgi:hypothetical protein